jgi:predicted nucleic-acid-binding protein
MRAIDTNVLVRIVAHDDPGQVESAESFIKEGAWVSLLVLAETVWTLGSKYGLNSAAIERAVSMLLEHDHIILQDAETVDAALVLFRSQRPAGFVDCLILALARKHGHLPLGTFDRNLAKLPGAQRL